MNYREKAFKEKFNNAAHNLGVLPNQVVSLKFRETVSSYSEYHHLLEMLKHEMGISYKKLKDNFQGTGYLLNDSHSKVIVVEHETGLEILYIVGSIASIIGLVHFISQCWNSMRGHFGFRHNRSFRDIEIRKLDDKGRIEEDHVHELEIHGATFLPNSVIMSATQEIEAEIKKLRQEVKTLTSRVKKIEGNVLKSNRKKTAKKTKAYKRRKISKKSS